MECKSEAPATLEGEPSLVDHMEQHPVELVLVAGTKLVIVGATDINSSDPFIYLIINI